jgi:hypothetical protein
LHVLPAFCDTKAGGGVRGVRVGRTELRAACGIRRRTPGRLGVQGAEAMREGAEPLTRGLLVVPQQEIQQRRSGPEILGDKESGSGVARDDARSKGATNRVQERESRVLVAQSGQTRTRGVVPRNPHDDGRRCGAAGRFQRAARYL